MGLRAGRRPNTNAINRIRQHVTLTTRDAKKAPNLAESVQQWTQTAAHVLDQDDPAAWAVAVTGTAAATFPRLGRAADVPDETVTSVAADVVDSVAMTRSTWTTGHTGGGDDRTQPDSPRINMITNRSQQRSSKRYWPHRGMSRVGSSG